MLWCIVVSCEESRLPPDISLVVSRFWPHRLTVRTTPFQGVNRSSILRGGSVGVVVGLLFWYLGMGIELLCLFWLVGICV